METGFSILMFIFGELILLYAALMAITKDYNILPRHSTVSVQPKDPKAYTFALSKVVALTGLAPILGGIVGFYSDLLGFVVMVAAVIAAIWFGLRFMKNVH